MVEQQLIWQELNRSWVIVPPRARGVIHFLGGAFIATAPHVTYRSLLESLANAGYAIVATPFVNTMDHAEIARQVFNQFEDTRELLVADGRLTNALPVYGLGHSMGCKLHVLIGSLSGTDRAGHILMAYNNFSARRSIPLLDQVMPWLSQAPAAFQATLQTEFTPSPEATTNLVETRYGIPHNLLIKFRTDELDETRSLYAALQARHPATSVVKILQGNHLTPVNQDLRWQVGTEFTPIDAIGQFVRQGLTRDLKVLQRTILQWLDPDIYSA